MEGKAWNARPMPSSRAAARTAKQPGLILAAAWVGGKLEGCPCRFHGDHLGCLVVLPQVLKSIDMAFSGNHLHHFGDPRIISI